MSLRDVLQFDKPLPDVQPAAYRRTIAIFLSPLVLFALLIFGVCDALGEFWRDWLVECWRGKRYPDDYWKREGTG